MQPAEAAGVRALLADTIVIWTAVVAGVLAQAHAGQCHATERCAEQPGRGLVGECPHLEVHAEDAGDRALAAGPLRNVSTFNCWLVRELTFDR